MRRLLIIALALLVTAGLAAPAVVGWLVHDRVRPALAERFPDAAIAWQAGWLRSRIELDSTAVSGRAQLRHLPMRPPGWLSLNARLVTAADGPIRADAIHVDGRMGLDGALSLAAQSDALDVPGPVAWQYRGPRLAVDARSDGGGRLHGSADWLLIHDRLGNQLAFTDGALEAVWTPRSEQYADLGLELELQRDGEAASRLEVVAESVDRQALGQLIEFGRQLIELEPESAAAGMAALGLVGAWQQLQQAGLSVELRALVVDGQGDLAGRWQPAAGQRALEMTGTLEQEATLAWAGQILGLGAALSPAEARAAAQAWLDSLVDQGLVRLDGRWIVPTPAVD